MTSVCKASCSVNSFCLKLYSKLIEEKHGNLFYSPTSISIAMAMTYAGAKAKTAEEIGKCMDWGNPDELHDIMATLQQSLCGNAGVELDLANRLWVQNDFAILNEFNQVLRSKYQADMGVVDFAKKTEESRKAINNWIEKKTNNKIKDLLEQGSLTPDTRLVLTNAVYFKGFWESQFDKEMTHDSDFNITPNSTRRTKFMNRTAMFQYAKNDMLSCQVIELPYNQQQVSMVILLPDAIDGLSQLEKDLTAEQLEMCSKITTREEVILSLPKFKIDYQLNMKSVLGKLGIVDLFSPNADLSGIVDNEHLFVSEVIHQAFVDVNEKGTEAAAATAVAVCTFAMPLEEPPHFLADHPFMFIIKHSETNAILFLGRVMNPVS